MNLYELAVVISATNRSAAVIKQAEQSLQGLSGAGDRAIAMGERWAVQGALMQGAADKLTGSLAAIAQPSQQVEDALAKVATVVTPLNTLEESMANIKDAALDWQNAHLDRSTQFIDTTYNMISAGLAEQAAIEGTRRAMMVARATMGDSTQAASLLATAYNNIGDKSRPAVEEMERLGDTITKTQQTFQFENLNQLTEGLKYGFPVLLQNKMAFSELSTVIGALNNSGIVGSQAGTSFAATMRVMGKASQDLGFAIGRNAEGGIDFIKTVANIEDKFGGLTEMSDETKQAFQDAFGAEGWMGLSLMIGKSEEMAANLAKVEDNANASEAAMAKMESTSSAQVQILSNQFDTLKTKIGDELTPLFASVGPVISDVVQAMTSFAESHPTLVRTGLLFAVILAAVMTVGSMVLIYAGSMMMFGGHAMKAAAMAGKAFIWMGKVMLPALWGAVKASLAWTASLLANPITWIVIAVVAAALLIYKYWGPISEFFAGMWAKVRETFVATWDGIKTAFSAALEVLPGILSGAMAILWTIIQEFTPVGWFITALNAVSEWLFGFSLYDAGKNVINSIVRGMRAMASKPVEIMRGIAQKVRNLLPFSPAKDGPLRDIHKIRLVETVAGAIHPAPLTDAMHRAVASAAAVPMPANTNAFRVPVVPRLVTPVGSARGGAGESGGRDLHLHLHLSGDADEMTVAKLRELLRLHGAEMLRLLKEEERKAQRGDFAA